MNSGADVGPASQEDAREQARIFHEGIRTEIQMIAEQIAALHGLGPDDALAEYAPGLISAHKRTIARLRAHLPGIPVAS